MPILLDDHHHHLHLHSDYHHLPSVPRLSIPTSRPLSVRPTPSLSPLCSSSPFLLLQEVDDSVCLPFLIPCTAHFSQGYEDHPDDDGNNDGGDDDDDDDDTTYADEEYPSKRKPSKKAKKHRLPSAHVIRPRGMCPLSRLLTC